MPTAPPRAPAQDPLLGIEVNGYQLMSVMGEGGMGKVYLGVHPLVGAKAAIKVLLPELAEDAALTERFIREARLLATLNHDRIVKIMGFGSLPDGRNYMVTEHLEGAALSRLIEREAPMPAARVLMMVDQILDALSSAHAAGVVHRDLKPPNVIVRTSGSERKVKLLDFGLARPRETDSEHPAARGHKRGPNASMVMGTPEYIAPEQARGLTPTPATDLYALGVMMFEMLTGRLPFTANNPTEMLNHHLRTPAPRVAQLLPETAPALDELVAQLMAKAPEERGAPADRVRKTVQKILRELPVSEPGARAPRGSGEHPRSAAPAEAARPTVPSPPPAPSAPAPLPRSAPAEAPPPTQPSPPTPAAPAAEAPRLQPSPAIAAALAAVPTAPPPPAPMKRAPAPPPAQPPPPPPRSSAPSRAQVDPAWAAARERAIPLMDDEAPRSRGGAGVYVGVGLGAVALAAVVALGLSTRSAESADGPRRAPLSEKYAAPEVRPEAAAAARRDPARACAKLDRWKADVEDDFRLSIQRYLRETPGAKPSEGPLADLEALLARARKVGAVEACVDVQRDLEAWREANLKPR